jgi:hypothetical protein
VRRENFHTHYSAEAIVHCLPAPTPAAPSGTSPAPSTTAGG